MNPYITTSLNSTYELYTSDFPYSLSFNFTQPQAIPHNFTLKYQNGTDFDLTSNTWLSVNYTNVSGLSGNSIEIVISSPSTLTTGVSEQYLFNFYVYTDNPGYSAYEDKFINFTLTDEPGFSGPISDITLSVGQTYNFDANVVAKDLTSVTISCTSTTLTGMNCYRPDTTLANFTIASHNANITGNHTITISAYINSNDTRNNTFVVSIDGPPYFTSFLTGINLRPGQDQNITIPAATDDGGDTIYYGSSNTLPSGATVSNTVAYGNTFEFKDITASMNGTYQFTIFA